MRCLSFFLRASRGVLLALLLTGACASASASTSCNGYASNLVFGTIDVLGGGIADSTSTLTYSCSSDPGTQVLLCLSLGADPGTNSYDPRNLSSTINGVTSKMAFNMYADAARTQIWGATVAPSSYPPVALTMSFGSGEYYKSTTTTIYGRVKSTGQASLPAGTYDTNSIGGWPLSITYKAYNGKVPKCSTGGMSTANSTFYIQATVVSDCRLTSVSNIDFGTVYATLTQNVDATGAIVVTCNGGQSGNGYHIRLGDGLNPAAANGQRRMQGPGGTLLNYELYKDAGRTTRWGNSDYLGVAGTGTGQPQSWTVYGRVPAQPVPAAGKFTDTVVVTVSY